MKLSLIKFVNFKTNQLYLLTLNTQHAK